MTAETANGSMNITPDSKIALTKVYSAGSQGEYVLIEALPGRPGKIIARGVDPEWGKEIEHRFNGAPGLAA